jgi:sulfite exporter TauE/SafE
MPQLRSRAARLPQRRSLRCLRRRAAPHRLDEGALENIITGVADTHCLGTALIVILIGLDISLGTGARTRWLRAPERWGAWLWRHLAPARRLPMPSAPRARALLLGLLWGWLPCGLVYSVLLAAALAGGARGGALTMFGFGLGTLPTMTTLSYAGSWLPRRDGSVDRESTSITPCRLRTGVAPVFRRIVKHLLNYRGDMP